MTKTIELRSLLNGPKKQIVISPEIEKAFEDWKEKRAGENLEPLEIFYAGYILANPMVRDLFKKDKCELKKLGRWFCRSYFAPLPFS